MSDSDDEEVELEASPRPKKAKKRGKNKTKPPSVAGKDTRKAWFKKHRVYVAADVGGRVIKEHVGKKTGLGWDATSQRLVCSVCRKRGGVVYTVNQDSHDHLADHFGFGKKSGSAKHYENLVASSAQLPIADMFAPAKKETGSLLASPEEIKEFQVDIVAASARGGIAPAQMDELLPVFQKWVGRGLGQSLPSDGQRLMRNRLGDARVANDAAMEKERQGHQLNLAGDAAHDNRSRSVFLSTAEFDGGKSQLVDIAFPQNTLNHKRLGTINSRVIAKVGGNEMVDTYHQDSVAYAAKWGLTLGSTFTLLVPDPCHRLDAILEYLVDIPVLEDLISILNNLFSPTNRQFVSGFYEHVGSLGFKSKHYPSPGETRAWTGSYRVIEWLYLYLDVLDRYVLDIYPKTSSPPKALTRAHVFFTTTHTHDLKVKRSAFCIILCYPLNYRLCWCGPCSTPRTLS